MNLTVRPDALVDLDRALWELAMADEAVVLRFRAALKELFDDIAEWPKVGELLKRTEDGKEIRRRSPRRFPNHQVLYAILPSEIVVARILRGARDWQSILRSGLIEGIGGVE
jgi:plasmid stabilization system protein ParE